MKPLTIDEVKKSELETLVIFRNFCEKHGLRYYLAFGTLLGAVRHRGYIPWDDDVDVQMPREDYDFFVAHFNEEAVDHRSVLAKENCPDFYVNFAKVVDDRTVMREEEGTMDVGVWIDIFPLEYMVDNERRYRRLNKLYKDLFWMDHRRTLQFKKGRVWYKNLLLPAFRLLCPSHERVDAMRARCVRRMRAAGKSETYGLLHRDYQIWGVPVFQKADYEPSDRLEFEGELFDVPGNYDRILRKIYKNYMELPPPEKRVSHHKYVCYWKESAAL